MYLFEIRLKISTRLPCGGQQFKLLSFLSLSSGALQWELWTSLIHAQIKDHQRIWTEFIYGSGKFCGYFFSKIVPLFPRLSNCTEFHYLTPYARKTEPSHASSELHQVIHCPYTSFCLKLVWLDFTHIASKEGWM